MYKKKHLSYLKNKFRLETAELDITLSVMHDVHENLVNEYLETNDEEVGEKVMAFEIAYRYIYELLKQKRQKWQDLEEEEVNPHATATDVADEKVESVEERQGLGDTVSPEVE